MPNPCTPGAEPVTLIACGTLLKGELSFDTAARILGRVEGRITTAGRLEIGTGAHCRAQIDAGTLIIEGTVEGDVTARERLELRPTAVVTGSLCAPSLIVAEGASIKGPCAIGAPVTPPFERPTTASTPVTAPAPTGIVTRPAHTTDLDGAIAGLESKLAGLSKSRTLNGLHAAV